MLHLVSRPRLTSYWGFFSDRVAMPDFKILCKFGIWNVQSDLIDDGSSYLLEVCRILLLSPNPCLRVSGRSFLCEWPDASPIRYLSGFM